MKSERLIPITERDGGYSQIFEVLTRRWIWVAGSLVVSLGFATFTTLRQVPIYESSMDLLIEPNYKNKSTDRQDKFADTDVQADTKTQINLMQSSDLLKQVMLSLQTQYPELDPNVREHVQAFKRSIAIEQVTAKSNGQADEEGKIVRVIYTSDDADKTQNVLKVLKQVYLAYNLEQQRLRLERGVSFINNQLPQIQAKVRESEAALERFRRTYEVVDPEIQAKAQGDTLNRLQDEKRTVENQVRELQSRFASLQQRVRLSPDDAAIEARLSQSTRYQTLLTEIQKTDLAIEQQRVRFKDNTPMINNLLDQRRRQINLLEAEVQKIAGESVAPARQNTSLFSTGQLTPLDLTLVSQLIDAEINLRAAQTRYLGLQQTEAELRENLKRYPMLLAEYGRLQPEVQLNRDTFKSLLKARQDLSLEIARGGFGWQVVEEPQPGIKKGPSLPRNLLLGVIAGLLLGGAIAFLREALDDAVHSSDDLKRQSTVPLLGTVPELALPEGRNTGLSGALFRDSLPFFRTSVDPALQQQSFRESLDLLYQNIQLLESESPLKSIVLTSALVGEGKSTLALGLAISAARLHRRVLLIDGDLRHPSLHKLLNLPNHQGLSTLLSATDSLPVQPATQASNLRNNISVLTAGPIPLDPAKLLSSQRMRDVIALFEQRYDLVIVDTPQVLGVVDVVLEARCCSGVLLVGRIGQVTRSELTQAIAALSKLNLIGIVANHSSSMPVNILTAQAS